jgi:tyrosinase
VPPQCFAQCDPDTAGKYVKLHVKLLLTLLGTGFDPIFFLHHCNVDRILAFWEHIYPDYVAGENGYPAPDGTRSKFSKSKAPSILCELKLMWLSAQPDGTFVQRGDPEVTDSTNLAPFRKDKDSYWNPHDTHSMNEKFGKEKRLSTSRKSLLPHY